MALRTQFLLASLFVALLCVLSSCKDDASLTVRDELTNRDLTATEFAPIVYRYNLPDHFPEMPQPEDNLATQAGVRLGQRLFFDPLLSIDSTISCATCHKPELAFTDGLALSEGAGQTDRSSMSLVNVGLQNLFFWDGRSGSLEDQSLHPIEDANEMANTWENVEQRLRRHNTYPEAFRQAFGIERSGEIDRQLVTKAIAQFERSIISGGAKYDQVVHGLDGFFTELEEEGLALFFREASPEHPGCSHCHNAPSFADIDDEGGFRNNGLDAVDELDGFSDPGRGAVTGDAFDNGKFRAPTLRNIELTAPYMHDGRFKTLDEVLEHYASGGHHSPTRDPLMHTFPLDNRRKEALTAFLETLTDREALSRSEVNAPR